MLPAAGRGRRGRGRGVRAGLARHPAARPLHRGVAGQGDGGARRRAGRPPTPASSPPSSTAATCGRRARPWCPASPPSPWSACSSATSPTWSTTASPPRWRTTSTRSRPGTEEALPWLTRFYFGSAGAGRHPPRGATATRSEALGLKATVAAHLSEIDAREINSIPLGDGDATASRSWRGSAATGPTSSGGRPGLHPRRPGARRADDRAGRGDPRRAVQRPRARRRPRERARRAGQGRAASGPTSRWAR